MRSTVNQFKSFYASICSFSSRCAILIAWFALVGLTCSIALARDAQVDKQEILTLIDKLGAEQYATRIEAQTKLQNYGVHALDLLRQATNDSNPQIATTATYLIRSSNVVWAFEGDGTRVRKLLRSYGASDLAERALKVTLLAKFSDDEGLAALARIARYEAYGDLSKRAALAILTLPEANMSLEAIAKRWQSTQTLIDQGKNSACDWLRKHAEAKLQSIQRAGNQQNFDMAAITVGLTLPKPFEEFDYLMPPFGLLDLEQSSLRMSLESIDVPWWLDHIEQEKNELLTYSGESSTFVVSELCQFSAKMFIRAGDPTNAVLAARQLLSLPVDKIDEIRNDWEQATWAIDNAIPDFAIELMQPYENDTRWAGILQYTSAEAYQWQGNQAKADEIATAALTRSGFGIGSPGGEERRRIADHLERRALLAWARKEYEAALAEHEKIDPVRVDVILAFARMLQDQGDIATAVALWEPVMAKIDTDPLLMAQLNRDFAKLNSDEGRTACDFFRSMYLHLKGMDQTKQGEIEAAKEDFKKAMALWPENVDVAIEMFKLDGDASWKAEVQKSVEKATQAMLADAKRNELLMRTSQADSIASTRKRYANSLNTYAWLIANVDSNAEFALETSLLSNRLEPDNFAYVDTLARCYYGVGNLEMAVYWQEKAFRLAPQQRELLRQLLEYRAELNKTSEK